MKPIWRAAGPHFGPGWAEDALTLAGAELRKAVVEYLYTEFKSTWHSSATEDFNILVYENMTSRNALRVLRALERTIEIEYAILVAMARSEGESWSKIGQILGLSKQATQQRFGSIASRIEKICTVPTKETNLLANIFPDAFFPGIDERELRGRMLAAALTEHYSGTRHEGWSYDWDNHGREYVDNPPEDEWADRVSMFDEEQPDDEREERETTFDKEPPF